MGLREIAEADLGLILEDADTGFGFLITLTDPTGTAKPFTGFSNDISELIDPDTGQAVSGRLATVALRIQPIYDAGFELPVAIADSNSRPWVVGFDDINGRPHVFKVSESNPDRAAGSIVLKLEGYTP